MYEREHTPVLHTWAAVSIKQMSSSFNPCESKQRGSKELLHLHKLSHGNRLEPPFMGPVWGTVRMEVLGTHKPLE